METSKTMLGLDNDSSEKHMLPYETQEGLHKYYTICDSEIGKKEKRRRVMSCCDKLYLSIVLVALLLIGGALVFLVHQKTRNPQTQVFTGEQITPEGNSASFACVPCTKLLQNPSDIVDEDPLLKTLTIEFKDDVEQCCAYSSEQITTLFECIMRVNDQPDPPISSFNATDFNFSPVSAHKRLYPARMLRTFGVPEIPPEPPVCLFKPDDPRYGLEHHRGVDILDRGLQIKFGGIYYIYVSILFRPQSTHPCSDFKYQVFTAYVEKVSQKRHVSQNLLKLSQTCCDDCTNSQEVRFAAGVFPLQSSDVIRVRVMAFELVHFNAYTTYAGLMMLGSPDKDEQSLRIPDTERSSGAGISPPLNRTTIEVEGIPSSINRNTK